MQLCVVYILSDIKISLKHIFYLVLNNAAYVEIIKNINPWKEFIRLAGLNEDNYEHIDEFLADKTAFSTAIQSKEAIDYMLTNELLFCYFILDKDNLVTICNDEYALEGIKQKPSYVSMLFRDPTIIQTLCSSCTNVKSTIAPSFEGIPLRFTLYVGAQATFNYNAGYQGIISGYIDGKYIGQAVCSGNNNSGSGHSSSSNSASFYNTVVDTAGEHTISYSTGTNDWGIDDGKHGEGNCNPSITGASVTTYYL